MATDTKVCRLCLRVVVSNCEPLNDHIADMLKTIGLDLRLAISDNPLICYNCLDVLRQSYDFKTTYLRNQEYLRNFLAPDSSVKLVLEEIIPKNLIDNEIDNEDEYVCRFCLNYFDSVSFVKFDHIDEDIFLKDMLNNFLQQIDLNITERPLMCHDCMENLQAQFNFSTHCLGTEESIRNYITLKGPNDNGKIDLNNVRVLGKDLKKFYKCVQVEINCLKLEGVAAALQADFLKATKRVGPSFSIEVKKGESEDVTDQKLVDKTEGNSSFSSTENGVDLEREARPGKPETPAKNHQCHYCQFSAKRKHQLTEHLTTVHEIVQAGRFQCDSCQFKTFSKPNLVAHQKKHLEDKPFKCEKCSKTFVHRIYLDGHILKNHVDLRPLISHKIYDCVFCNYETVHSWDLSRHIKYHHEKSAARRYICNECDFSCIEKSMLNRHTRIHAIYREFLCSECAEGFSTKYKLDAHIMYCHPGNEMLVKTVTNYMYQCEFCSYKTVGLNHYKRHMEVHESRLPKE